MKFKLTRVADGSDIELTTTLVAGRLAECDIQLTQGLPSRRHGQIALLESAAWVEDLGSANGTFVNGVKIAARTQLRAGDVVRFDVEEFRLSIEDDAQVDAAAATLYRAPPNPKPAHAEPAPAAPTQQVAESSGLYKRPGAWADPDSDDGGNKTKFMDSAALKAMIDQAPKLNALSPNDAVDAPSLVVLSGSRNGACIKLHTARGNAAEWSIGSSGDCAVQFSEDGVSALHAKLVNDGQRWKLIDQMSANGTYVNGKRGSMVYLSAGDRIAIGPVECEFQLPTAISEASQPIKVAASDSRPKPLFWVAVGVAVLAAIIALIGWRA